jgi:hypothetical protein
MTTQLRQPAATTCAALNAKASSTAKVPRLAPSFLWRQLPRDFSTKMSETSLFTVVAGAIK